MLMNANMAERYEFVRRITIGSQPAFRRTYDGDEAKQNWWRANQPLLYAAARIQDHTERVAA